MAEDHPISHVEADRIRSLLASFYQTGAEEPLSEIFHLCDSNHDGKLSSKELKQLMNAILDDVVRDSEVDAIMQRADLNHDGVIDLDEFVNAMKRTTSA